MQICMSSQNSTVELGPTRTFQTGDANFQNIINTCVFNLIILQLRVIFIQNSFTVDETLLQKRDPITLRCKHLKYQ